MKRRIFAAISSCVLVTGSLVGLASTAEAIPKSPVAISIQVNGKALSGTVTSGRPGQCAANRVVKVFRIVNGVPRAVAKDTTKSSNGQIVWGTTVRKPGRYFAKLRATPQCMRALSPKVRVS
jgi:hypothetical protein